jgi:Ca-activated chloride channel homolog
MFEFAQPWWFLLTPLLLGAAWGLLRRKNSAFGTLLLPTAAAYAGLSTWRTQLRPHLKWLVWAAGIALMIALARPQRTWQEQQINADGIDIMLAIDISPSMLSRDFQPDRLTVAKQVAIDFVKKRPADRIGLVAYAGEAFTQSPPTTDHQVLSEYIEQLSPGVLDDGTAIGLGLATALNRLRSSNSKTQIVILMTDGENNSGDITPEQATEMAQRMGIRTYTVGLGKEGLVESPVSRYPDGSYAFEWRQSGFNTNLLEQIAIVTKGRFFRAYSSADLKDIYNEIDQMEKSKVEVTSIRRFTDFFHWPLGVAIFLLLLELMLAWVVMRTVE